MSEQDLPNVGALIPDAQPDLEPEQNVDEQPPEPVALSGSSLPAGKVPGHPDGCFCGRCTKARETAKLHANRDTSRDGKFFRCIDKSGVAYRKSPDLKDIQTKPPGPHNGDIVKCVTYHWKKMVPGSDTDWIQVEEGFFLPVMVKKQARFSLVGGKYWLEEQQEWELCATSSHYLELYSRIEKRVWNDLNVPLEQKEKQIALIIGPDLPEPVMTAERMHTISQGMARQITAENKKGDSPEQQNVWEKAIHDTIDCNKWNLLLHRIHLAKMKRGSVEEFVVAIKSTPNIDDSFDTLEDDDDTTWPVSRFMHKEGARTMLEEILIERGFEVDIPKPEDDVYHIELKW